MKQVQSSLFTTIKQDNSNTLEIGFIDQAIEFRLTTKEKSLIETLYTGRIEKLSDVKQLKQPYKTLLDAFELLKEIKESIKLDIKLDMNEKYVALFYIPLGQNKCIQIAKILLIEQVNQSRVLQNLITKCNEKDALSSDEIKTSIQTLTIEMIKLQKNKKSVENNKKTKITSFNQEFFKLSNSQLTIYSLLFLIIFLIPFLYYQHLNIVNSLKTKNLEEHKKMQSETQALTNQTIKRLSTQLQQYKTKIANLQNQIKQKWSNKFSFDGRFLQKIADNEVWMHYFFIQQIPFDEQFSFKVTIVQSESNVLMIGVVDYELQKQEIYSFDSGNAVAYHAYDGQKYPGEEQEGSGIQIEETVEVRINRRNSSVKWMVNNVQIASHTSQILGDASRILIPYVDMHHVNDIIKIEIKH